MKKEFPGTFELNRSWKIRGSIEKNNIEKTTNFKGKGFT